MTRTKAFTAERHAYEAGGHTFLITKGASRYARYYVVDPETFKYLSKRGHATLLDAQIEAEGIAKHRNVQAMIKKVGL